MAKVTRIDQNELVWFGLVWFGLVGFFGLLKFVFAFSLVRYGLVKLIWFG